jgi:protein-S-isoprenylcysteine O-methyltransferase Ste14
MIDGLEQTMRLLGAAGLMAAWMISGSHAARSRQLPAGRGLGMAPKLGALTTYLMAAVPYFVAWIVLWRRLPGTPPDWFRLVAVLLGGLLGAAGLAIYLWGRLTLGSMYNVSSVLGCELYADHRLVTSGPFRFVRHPMYFGIALAALGALAIYRTWAMVFAVAVLPAFTIKARHEEQLLAAEFGSDWQQYAQRVPAWWPRLPSAGRPRAMLRGD